MCTVSINIYRYRYKDGAEDGEREAARVIAAGLHAYFEEYLAETEIFLADIDQRGFYKHLEGTVELEGRNARSDQFVRDEDSTLLRDKVRILEQ